MFNILSFIYKQNLFSVFLITVIFILLAAFAFSSFLYKYSRIICSVICFFTLFFVLFETIFSRPSINFDIELRPFYTFVLAQSQPEYYRTFFMNVLLFVPIGLSMPYCLSKKPYKRNVFITIGFTCVLSAAIEFLQYYYHLGRCEIDDVIANTFGAAVGTLSYLIYMRILKNREESLMNSKINDNQKLLLDLCAKSLFNKNCDLPDEFNCGELLYEAKRQTVFSQVFSFIKDKCDKNTDKLFSQIIAKNIRVQFGHNEVHKVLTENNIPYVVLKGVASASYYKEPTLRMMGDIDILVSPDNIEKADKALKSIGFITNEALNCEGHIAYKRRDGLVCELHRSINGIPKNAAGEKISEYFADAFEKSIDYKMSNGCCVLPSKFHHGLILLLHTANHLTKEGVGLRHLCDWAVFVNSFSNDEFVATFEKPLKQTGLWRFAQLLTLCCIKYLGCDPKEWVGEVDDDLITGITVDILNGGNFGVKDADRYSQIKYITDRKKGETSQKGPIAQLFSSINQKTKKEFKFVNKSKFLLPIGWIFTVCKYFYMVIIGKRSIDGYSTINGAKKRTNIYSKFHLYEID